MSENEQMKTPRVSAFLLVFMLVLFAFASLICALVSGSPVFAWNSVGLCIVASVVLFRDFRAGRAQCKEKTTETESGGTES